MCDKPSLYDLGSHGGLPAVMGKGTRPSDQRDEDGCLPLRPNKVIHGTWYAKGVVEAKIEAERKRCCEDVCLQCEEAARPDSEVHAAERRDHDGHWEHEYIKDGVAYWCSCTAAAIHERAAKSKE